MPSKSNIDARKINIFKWLSQKLTLWKDLYLHVSVPQGGAEHASNKKSWKSWNARGKIHHGERQNLVNFSNRL
jgi:hypothetical protein